MISITLPSIFPKALDRALANIRETTRGDYEVLVVSPFEVKRPNVVWMEERERKGCARAHDLAAAKSSGEYVTAFADDFLYVDGWDQKVLEDFAVREKIWRGEYLMGLRYDLSSMVGTVFGMYYANFPFMRKENLARYGWIGPDYRAGFGDADLSMRVWHRGGACEYSRDKVLIVTPDDQRKAGVLHSPEDLRLFVSRWARQYGKGWKEGLRDFNRDVIPEELPFPIDSRTIYYNDPDFLSLLEKKAPVSDGPPYLVESVGEQNIVAYKGRYYRVPQALGSLDLSLDWRLPGIKEFLSVEESRAL